MKTYLTTEENNLKGVVKFLDRMLVRIACYLYINGQIDKGSFAEAEIDRIIRCSIGEHMSDSEFVQDVAKTCKASLYAVLEAAAVIEKGD
ncbi:MAG TPA: hypothetical protein VM223_14465 [Planctomycetota bacterium]|nr:hypothetical protein [Planctomycetota bacterium]